MRAASRALAALALGALCAPAPAPAQRPQPKPEIVLRSAANDEQAGREAAEQVAAEIGLLDDTELAAYVERIGQGLARNAPSGGFRYRFQVVDQDVPNAFAVPGGFVYVSRGLLALANTETELANVIGHEIVHVARRHAAARQALVQGLPGFFQFAAMAHLAAYGRDQEREADRLGQGLAALAGYDPQGLADFLNSLEWSERLHLGFSRFQGWLDTHPATSDRVAAAAARARTIPFQARAGAAGRPDYLRRIDGLVVGTAASEGVFQEERFLHPELGFSLLFPAGWEVLNTRRAVGAVAPTRNAQVALEFQGRGDNPEQAANEFIAEHQSEGLRVERLQRVAIAGLPAVRAVGRASSPVAPVSVHLTWIAREGSIYRLTGAALGGDERLAGIFNNVARSFRPITPAERRSIRETRLRVVEAAAGESLSALSRRTRNEWDIQQTAVMNGVFADASFAAGDLVKVAVSQPYGAAPDRAASR
jgi:predicted Zn-dependent protease